MQPTITVFLLSALMSSCFAAAITPQHYTETNQALVSFDVSMPIDSTGYTLQGTNLTGGTIQFTDHGTYLSPLLASETGSFQLPIVKNRNGSPLIQTDITYHAIKFINPNGINNLFIKVGIAKRSQKVHGLDPSVLKNGSYTWQAPIFAVGKESNTVNNKSDNNQFIQVGSIHGGPASKNVMYTQDFYLYTRAHGNTPIIGQPIRTGRSSEVLSKAYTSHYTCHADGLWGAGGADPYRTITGTCQGNSMTTPAGPDLDYESGTFTLPTVHTPWTATPKDHCIFPGNKRHTGCVNASIALNVNYIAQKIRVPINKRVTVFAESGTAYRSITPTNLLYVCNSNIYLNKILPKADCTTKNYLAGGASYTYFAVGYDYQDKNGTRYTAKYINIPGQENGNRLAWLDASNTYIYATSVSDDTDEHHVRQHLAEAIHVIKEQQPQLYNIIHTIMKIKNHNS